MSYPVFRSWQTFGLDKTTTPTPICFKCAVRHTVLPRCGCYRLLSSSHIKPPSLNTEDNFNNTFYDALFIADVKKHIAIIASYSCFLQQLFAA